jgi:hypothetical protein
MVEEGSGMGGGSPVSQYLGHSVLADILSHGSKWFGGGK